MLSSGAAPSASAEVRNPARSEWAENWVGSSPSRSAVRSSRSLRHRAPRPSLPPAGARRDPCGRSGRKLGVPSRRVRSGSPLASGSPVVSSQRQIPGQVATNVDGMTTKSPRPWRSPRNALDGARTGGAELLAPRLRLADGQNYGRSMSQVPYAMRVVGSAGSGWCL